MLKGPWRELDERCRNVWLYGTGDRLIVHHWKNRRRIWSHAEKWEGVATELLAKYRKSAGGPTRAQLEPYMRSMTCPECQGGRLNPRARAVRVGGKTLVELGAMPIGQVAGSSTPWPRRRPREAMANPRISFPSTRSRGRSPTSCSRRSAGGSGS